MRSKFMLLGLTLSALFGRSDPAFADALSAGNAAYAKGDIGKAIEKWQKSPKAEAMFRIAELAEAGKLQDCDVVYCAVSWYRKAALAGHIPSVTHVAILNFNNGFEEDGLNQFRLAARLNDPLARDLLAQMKQAVPAPDLYYQALEEQRQRQAAAQRAKEQQQAQLAYILGYMIGCGFGGGCAAPTTVQSGYAVPVASPTPTNLLAPRRREAVSTSYTPQAALPAAPNGGLRRFGFDEPQKSDARIASPSYPTLCPDGTYVQGRCSLAPDGDYVGGQPQLAPDGTYVSGQPTLAPNGRYVGGGGPTILCPDGSYVSGHRCRLTPDGRYVGE